MANTTVANLNPPGLSAPSGTGALAVLFFSAWLALVFFLGARGAFVAHPGAPPFALLLGLLVPLTLFLLAYFTVRPVREFILSADLRLIVGMQAWRWAGLGFLTLYTYRILPGIFAWPAGLGDMAVGITAIPVLASLLRKPAYAGGKRFVAWNLLGILDLTVAVSIGALVPILAPNFYGTVTTAPMSVLPLVLIPAFLVPTFLMLHLTALFQSRRLAT